MRSIGSKLFFLVVTVGLVSVSGCSRIAPQFADPAEARLRAGVMPNSVPLVPAGGALAVAHDQFRVRSFGYAARYFEQAVAERPTDPAAWLGLAASYDRLRRFDLADRAYARLAQLAGESAAYHNNVGYSYLLRGDAARARLSLGRAAALAPESLTVRNNMALLDGATSASPRDLALN